MSRRLEWAGVTVAIRAIDLPDPTSPEARQWLHDLGEQTVEHLRQAVGGIALRSEPVVRFDGPQDDALQGSIYALSISAQIDVDDLPVGSAMRAAWERNGVLTTDPGVIL